MQTITRKSTTAKRPRPTPTLDARPLLAAIEATLTEAENLKAILQRLPGDRATSILEDLDGLTYNVGIAGSVLECELSADGTLDAHDWATDWQRDLQAVRAMA